MIGRVVVKQTENGCVKILYDTQLLKEEDNWGQI